MTNPNFIHGVQLIPKKKITRKPYNDPMFGYDWPTKNG